VLSHWSKECYNIPKLMAAPYGEASSAEKPRLWERTVQTRRRVRLMQRVAENARYDISMQTSVSTAARGIVTVAVVT